MASFFDRDTETVAQELLGKFLVRKISGRKISAMITETEAYDGTDDKASHASMGRTKRTEVMFSHSGTLYVYLCYGMYYMLNVVTREHGYPAAVLIRGVLTDDKESLHIDGPGKLTKFFNIGKSLNSQVIGTQTGLWFEDRKINVMKGQIENTARVGVAYAGPLWSKKKLRYVLKTKGLTLRGKKNTMQY